MNRHYIILGFVFAILYVHASILNADDIKIKKNPKGSGEYNVTVGNVNLATVKKTQSKGGHEYTIKVNEGTNQNIKKPSVTNKSKKKKKTKLQQIKDYFKRFSITEMLMVLVPLLLLVWISYSKHHHHHHHHDHDHEE